MGIFHKKEKQTEETEQRTRIEVYTDNGLNPIILENKFIKYGRAHPWRKFLKWFYCRPQSEYYTFKWDNGMVTCFRKRIIGFRIIDVECPIGEQNEKD